MVYVIEMIINLAATKGWVVATHTLCFLHHTLVSYGI